jgi:predicted N-acyltransferase
MPAPIHSAHWIRDPRLAAAIAAHLQREAAVVVRRQMKALAQHGPFRRG